MHPFDGPCASELRTVRHNKQALVNPPHARLYARGLRSETVKQHAAAFCALGAKRAISVNLQIRV